MSETFAVPAFGGKTYEFEAHPLDAALPKVAGVLVVARIGGDGATVLWVAAADSAGGALAEGRGEGALGAALEAGDAIGFRAQGDALRRWTTVREIKAAMPSPGAEAAHAGRSSGHGDAPSGRARG